MAKGIGPFICILIIVLDIIAGILGIEAEIAQDKVKHLKLWIFECRDPSQQAFNLGLAAAFLLGLAHVIANLLGGFVCICSKDELDTSTANKQLAAACLILSWIILAVAFSMLIIGTLANGKSKGSCGISHNRFLSIGGVLCFVHGLFCVSYYVSANATIEEDKKMVHAGPAAV
ncbi:Protein DESIGUAL 2 [Ranunculus cassubicifolius]